MPRRRDSRPLPSPDDNVLVLFADDVYPRAVHLREVSPTVGLGAQGKTWLTAAATTLDVYTGERKRGKVVLLARDEFWNAPEPLSALPSADLSNPSDPSASPIAPSPKET